MKNKGKIIKYGILVVILLIIIVARVNHVMKSQISTDEVSQFVFITDDFFKPNESGDYTNVRYEIDFEEKKVVKYEDYYTDQKKLIYKDSVAFDATIGSKYRKTLTECIDKIIANWKENGNTKEDSYWTLVVKNKKIRFSDEEIIKTLLKVME